MTSVTPRCIAARTCVAVGDVALDERVARVAGEVGEVREVAGVGEGVEVDDADIAGSVASRWRMKFVPMNPHPPVTRTVGHPAPPWADWERTRGLPTDTLPLASNRDTPR